MIKYSSYCVTGCDPEQEQDNVADKVDGHEDGGGEEKTKFMKGKISYAFFNCVSTHRQGVATLDTSAIYDGVFKPENIAIHLAQNVVNFLASTLAWGFLLHLYGEEFQIILRIESNF